MNRGLFARSSVTWIAVTVAAVLLGACSSSGSTTLEDAKQIDCRGSDALLLAFQAVPSATYVPCITAIPVGWSFGGSQIRNGRVQFWLNSDRAGWHAAEVTLEPACDTSAAVKTSTTAPPEPGISRFEQPISLPPRFVLDRFDVFAGGCVTYHYDFQRGASSLLVFEVDQALSFFTRTLAVRKVKEQIGMTLCGAEAPPCPG